MSFTPKAWKNGESGGTKLNAAGLIDLEERVTSEAALPSSVVSNSTVIDFCRTYAAAPLEDITTKLTEAIAAVVALGGGIVYISKPGIYYINGAMLEGTALGRAYAGQILFPARTNAEKILYISIQGCAPAGEGDASTYTGVILRSNATKGSIFDVIAGDEIPLSRPGSNLLPHFQNLTIESPTNPQCSALNLYTSYRAKLDNVVIGTPEKAAELTGSGYGLKLPQTNNAGQVDLTKVFVRGYPTALGLTEQANMWGVQLYDALVAIECLGGGHVNYFGHVEVASCQTVLKAVTNGGALCYGQLDWENVVEVGKPYGPTTFFNDVNGLLHGSIDINLGTPAATNKSYLGVSAAPNSNAVSLDYRFITGLNQLWKANPFPRDTFERIYYYAGGAPGICSKTGHPWRVTEGAFSITKTAGNGELKSTSAGEAGTFLPAVNPGLTGMPQSKRAIYATISPVGATTFNISIMGQRVCGGARNGNCIRVQLWNNKTCYLKVNNVTRAEKAAAVESGKTYAVVVALTVGATGYVTKVQVYLGGTEILSYELTVAEQESLAPGTVAPYLEDGLQFAADKESVVTELGARPF